MAAYNLITDGQAFVSGVYSLVTAKLDGGAGSHTITLPAFFARDADNVTGVAWIIEACGISMDQTDVVTVTVADVNANGPSMSQTLSGTTSVSFRVLAGEWFPSGCIVTIATDTGVDVAIRFSARKDREIGGGV